MRKKFFVCQLLIFFFIPGFSLEKPEYYNCPTCPPPKSNPGLLSSLQSKYPDSENALLLNAGSLESSVFWKRKPVVLWTYQHQLILKDGRNGEIDIERTVSALKDLGATAVFQRLGTEYRYNNFINLLKSTKHTDIKIYIIMNHHCNAEPSPYKGNCTLWIEHLAELSLEYPNLEVVVFDDLHPTTNPEKLTPAFISNLIEAKDRINPLFKFIPTLYYDVYDELRFFRKGNEFEGVFKDGTFMWYWASYTRKGTNMDEFERYVNETRSLSTPANIITGIYSQRDGYLESTFDQEKMFHSPSDLRKMVELGYWKTQGLAMFNFPLYMYDPDFFLQSTIFKQQPNNDPAFTYRLTNSGKGTHVSWYQAVKTNIPLNHGSDIRVKFKMKDSKLEGDSGYIFKQLLINDEVLWEEDITISNGAIDIEKSIRVEDSIADIVIRVFSKRANWVSANAYVNTPAVYINDSLVTTSWNFDSNLSKIENYKEIYDIVKSVINDTLIMEVDTFGIGQNYNMLGGAWSSICDGNSSVHMELNHPGSFNDTSSGKFEWVRNRSDIVFPFVEFGTSLNENNILVNLHGYQALKFQCKGSGVLDVGVIAAESGGNEEYYYFQLTLPKDWTNIEIPFSELKANGISLSRCDSINVKSIKFLAKTDFDILGEMWIDNIQFISGNLISQSPVAPPAKPFKPFISHQPKVNQLGYLPAASKQFSIISDSVMAGQEFFIVNELEEEVFSGNIEVQLVDDSQISGEKVYRGNFSGLNINGSYKVKVGKEYSYPFEIHKNVYDSALYHMLRFFYLVRANNAIDDPVTGLYHPESHSEDASLSDGTGNTKDLTGGWYNGSNFGKWVPTTAFACAHLMNLYEANPEYFRFLDLTIPDNSQNLPDILIQSRTGLDWLLKMQRSDGAVYHNIVSVPFTTLSYGPDEDPNQRLLGNPDKFSTIDAAVFTAVIAHASRVYASFDSLFSATCRNAALKSWNWIQLNSGTGQEDSFYTDPLSWQEEMWAKAEVFMITEDQTILSSFYNDLRNTQISQPSWSTPQMFGCISINKYPGLPSIVKSWIKQIIEKYATDLKMQVELSGYGCAVDVFNWQKGSNAIIANYGAAFIYAYMITGNDNWLNYASQQLDYLFGRNSLEYSFVTGFGSRKFSQPFHWITRRYGITPAGFIGQGALRPGVEATTDVDDIANGLLKAGFPPAKNYIDSVDSWTFNETDIYSVSSLTFLTGFLSLYKRDINTSTAFTGSEGMNKPLTILYRNGNLYCEDCNGNVTISLYNLKGQLIYKNVVSGPTNGHPLIDDGRLLKGKAVLLYKITDKKNSTANGKITVSQAL